MERPKWLKEELQNQAKDSDLALVHQELGSVKGQLAQVWIGCDKYANKTAQMIMNPPVGAAVDGNMSFQAPAACKSTKTLDPPILTDGKEP